MRTINKGEKGPRTWNTALITTGRLNSTMENSGAITCSTRETTSTPTNMARAAVTNLERGIGVAGRPAGLSDEFQPIISTLNEIFLTSEASLGYPQESLA